MSKLPRRPDLKFIKTTYSWGDVVGCRPDVYFTCDECGAGEDDDTIYRDANGCEEWGVTGEYPIDMCGWCIRRKYRVNDIVLAFYSEMAEFLNQDSDLAATAVCSIAHSWGDLRGLVVIRSWRDYQNYPAPASMASTIKVFSITGSMHEEEIEFNTHYGIVNLNADEYHINFCGNTDSRLTKVKWLTLDPNVQINHFKYNVFDNIGMDLLFEWVKNGARNWLLRNIPKFKDKS